MFSITFILVILGVLVDKTLQVNLNPQFHRKISTRQDDSYVAAVLEYNFSSNTSVNLEAYLGYIRDAAEQNADIVVFPELCLNRGDPVVVLDPKLYDLSPALIPDDFDPILVRMSQAAIDNNIYIVVNVEEKLDCSNNNIDEVCPENKVYIFNTNIVYDRSGTIIDRFRKINLFGEPTRTSSPTRELGVFETDFGVTFGHFICFDLMFQVPAIQVVEKLKVTDVVFTTMWYSETPYLTAVQIQEAYAFAMNVNFLASGANSVAEGSSGSGIYSGRAGALISTMPGIPMSRLLVSRVPKVPGQLNGTYPGPIVDPPRNSDSFFMKPDPSFSAHVSKLIQPGFQEFTLTHNEVTCQFIIRMTARGDGVQYQYRAGAFDGVRTYSGYASGGVRLCSIFSCTSSDIDSCGLRFDEYIDNSTAIFDELSIIATVPTPATNETLSASDSFYTAVSLDVSTLPLKTEDFFYSEVVGENGFTELTLVLKNTDVEMYSFAIWGRNFKSDGQEPTLPSAAATVVLNFYLMAPILYVFFKQIFIFNIGITEEYVLV